MSDRETFGIPATGLSFQTRRIPFRGRARDEVLLLIIAAIILILATMH